MSEAASSGQCTGAVTKVHVELGAEEYENFRVTPWFSYRVNLPIKPIPSVPERPHIKTSRLLVRPIIPEDLENFHALRACAETQNRCE